MSNSSNPTPSLSKTAELAENNNWFKLSPLQWSKFNPTFAQTSHSVGVSKVTKN
tara:strand:+ start:2355 stop:2516 length:162 start_codon:yes stop_codon:yes gene_type:complete